MSTNFKRLTLEQRLQKFPPFLCLALSRPKFIKLTRKESNERRNHRRKGNRTAREYQWRRMNREEIAALTGIHYRRVTRIGCQINWDNVKVWEMLAFMKACGIDVCHAEKHRKNMKRRVRRGNPFRHLDPVQRIAFVATMRRYKAAMAVSAPSSPEPPSERSTTPPQ